MSEFSVNPLTQSSIQYLYSMREIIWLDPPYQRMGDIWSRDKRQLLVDSVLNGFDIPKLYFHELTPTKKIGKQIRKYAIIDGKQRLDALWAFMDGRFTMAEDFEYLHDKNVKLAGLTYREISEEYPLVRSRFDGTSLSVICVRTDDTDLIEDMFSRLNEAVPLNAPEKRNAFGGPLPKAIRDLAEHMFISSKIPYLDRRYRHRDLAAKLLIIEHTDSVADTKKVYLDAFVREWATRKRSTADATILRKSVEAHLGRMAKIFTDHDPLLKSVGMIILIYHYFRLLEKVGRIGDVKRKQFEQFEHARTANRVLAENDLSQASYDLLEFDKLVQTPNDAFATKFRLSIMIRFMRDELGVKLPERHSYTDFT